MSFGIRLRAARQKSGYTQKQLAALIGAKHNSVSNWENDQNKPDPDTIELICGVLDITPNYILGSDQNDVMDDRSRALIKKYQSLNETGKDQVDSYTDYIASNPANLANPPEHITYTTAAKDGDPGLETGTVNISQEEYDRLLKEAQMAQDLEDWG